jgi:hypothetical protein
LKVPLPIRMHPLLKILLDRNVGRWSDWNL